MPSSHFWQNACLLGIIFGAAILSAMIGTRAHSAPVRAVVEAQVLTRS